MPTSTTDRIAALKAEIESLERSAIQELKNKRSALAHELAEVEAEIAKITGESPGRKTRRSSAKAPGKPVTFSSLCDLLDHSAGKTINIRKEGFDTKTIKALAAANPGVLKLGGGGPWPTVTLVK